MECEIVLCSECEGKGEIYERADAYDSEYVECSKCNGAGRLRKIIEIRYERL